MWKSDFTVVNNDIVFHMLCGNSCGKRPLSVEITSAVTDFRLFHKALFE